MYLVKHEPTKTFIPCTSVSWVTGDYYICTISSQEDSYVHTKSIIAQSTEIFPIDIVDITHALFRSREHREFGGIGTLRQRPIKSEIPDVWYIQDGMIFTDYREIRDGYSTQFEFPPDILAKPGITMVNSPYIPTGRIIIEPIDKRPKTYRPPKKGRQHNRVLAYIDANGPKTIHAISEGLEIPISSASGRVSELSRMGDLRCVSFDYSTGVKRNVWGNKNHKSWI